MALLVLVSVGSSQQQSRLIIQRLGRRSLPSGIIRWQGDGFSLLFSIDKERLCIMFVILNTNALKLRTSGQRASL